MNFRADSTYQRHISISGIQSIGFGLNRKLHEIKLKILNFLYNPL
jgi:hypothetical protein